jgi:hypothetical protein
LILYQNVAGAGGTETISLNNPGRYVKMHGLQRATPWGFSLWEFEVYGGTPPPTGPNIALGKPVMASSIEDAGYAPQNAVDGGTSTRWSSAFADRQWIAVDLGGTYNIYRVVLNWETAYASDYALQISNDGVTWNTFRSMSKGSAGVDDLGVTAIGRYVRMLAYSRGTPWGVSLWEFEVYGTATAFGPNVAGNAIATASSSENDSLTPNNAIDGKLGTRWSSAFADGQSIVLDLGDVQPIHRVILRWEAAYASHYSVQYSNNPSTDGYFAMASQFDGHGGVEDWAVNASARYVRIYFGNRATPWGVSLWEIEVYRAQ